jgi:hypothetical protein
METLHSPVHALRAFEDFKNAFCDYANRQDSDLKHLDLGLVGEIFCFFVEYLNKGGEL